MYAIKFYLHIIVRKINEKTRNLVTKNAKEIELEFPTTQTNSCIQETANISRPVAQGSNILWAA